MKIVNKNIIRQIFMMTGIVVALFLCIVAPFLPGDYDAVAIHISLVTQTLSVIGIITSIPAALWLYHSLKNRNAEWNNLILDKQKKFARIYIYSVLIIFLPIVLMTTLTMSFSMGILLFITVLILSILTLRKISQSNSDKISTFHIPLFLTLLPILLLLFQKTVDKPITDWCRNRAIENSKEIIAEIEKHKIQYGNYPLTMNAVHRDYNVGIIGIEKYHYTYDDTTYNLYFEQPRFLLDQFGTREFVVYNPKDKHLMISHASWNARWNSQQIQTTQGWYATGNTGQPHWKYFWFD